MPVVWSDRCLLHEPAAEIWVGTPTPAAETPARATAILDALDARVVEAQDALPECRDVDPDLRSAGADHCAACILVS